MRVRRSERGPPARLWLQGSLSYWPGEVLGGHCWRSIRRRGLGPLRAAVSAVAHSQGSLGEGGAAREATARRLPAARARCEKN